MDIEALLNLAGESNMAIDETTDEEIFDTVLAARKAQDEGPINGGDDDAEDDASAKECPTHRDTLQVASVINRFIVYETKARHPSREERGTRRFGSWIIGLDY